MIIQNEAQDTIEDQDAPKTILKGILNILKACVSLQCNLQHDNETRETLDQKDSKLYQRFN